MTGINCKSLARSRGFSLVEVMVALVVCSIGLLGLAKMESLALSSTSVAAYRSLIAIEASSLAASMHANTGYWAGGSAPASTRISYINGALTITNQVLATAATCTTSGTNSCTPEKMAAYDLQQWGAALKSLVPAYFTTIACTTTTGSPVNCTITIQWAESSVAMTQQQTGMANLNLPTYVLYVQP